MGKKKKEHIEIISLDSQISPYLLKIDGWKSTLIQDENEKGTFIKKRSDREISDRFIHKMNITVKTRIINFFKNIYNLGLVLVLLTTLLLRLKYIGQESLWNDAAVHLWYVIKVVKEPLFAFSQQYILGDYFVPQSIMAFFYLFTKDAFLAGKIVAMIYALTGVTFMYLLGTELRSRFTGLMAALLLAFNHIFWFYSVRPLGDSPMLVTTIILLYFMVKLEKEKNVMWGVLSGITFLSLILTKKQAVIYVFALLIYYILFKRKEMFKNKSVLISWVIPAGSMALAHLLGKIFFGTWLITVYRLFFHFRGMPFGLEALGMLKWIFTWYLIPFVILGILFVIFYKKKEYYFGLVLFFFNWLFFEINVDNTQDRYMLPLLSIALILAVFSIEEIAYYFSLVFPKKARLTIKRLFVLSVVILICFNFYQIGDPLIYNKSFSYSGHEEAGKWIKNNVPGDVPIFAGSYRFLRFFSERDFGGPADEDLGGNIWNLRSETYYATNQSAFEEDLQKLSKKSDVYLEIDHIEYTQPSWYYPLTQESINYFTGLGFNLIQVFNGKVMTNEGPSEVPMIFIFKKDQVLN
jgi:hypothetical protein